MLTSHGLRGSAAVPLAVWSCSRRFVADSPLPLVALRRVMIVAD